MTECLLTDLEVGKCFVRTGITEEITETEIEKILLWKYLQCLHIEKKYKNSKIQMTRKAFARHTIDKD